MHLAKKTLLSTFFIFFIFQLAKAQTADELFITARKKAFDEKNYPEAIELAKTALTKSPDYADIRVFLGRLYTWTKKLDSARATFNTIITKQPDYEDAYVAWGNLEFWNYDTKKGIEIVDQGLKNIPGSETLLLLKAKLLADLNEWQSAESIVNQVIKNNPQQTEARALSAKIRENSALNKFGINYDYIHFDKQFNDPWHLLSIDYGRQTSIGAVIGRINYANRFNSSGLQFEMDSYPKIARNLQAYVNVGYSPDMGIFPKYRAGFSLYASLPLSLELEAGLRFLRSQDNTWIYTASVGKYYKNFWFNLRTFLTPSTTSLSQSFILQTRYYLRGADDYLNLSLSTGLSPDEQRNNILINATNYKLKSNGIMLGYRKSFKAFNIVNFKAGIENQEYFKDTKGNQLILGVGYIRRF
ncbi:YaiO family outer membrane beta-barrel protein [Pedobacter insulae]|uniref:Outer membrane protein, YaiO family n=1 Tax=Pedobacter insulae TaxID=414048 RepID=A0A1I2UMX1_9SPHI|nr:YaiO family outer membrane beta-barrel protein [Pedobacter insulae]SFG78502.1 outer membrane protein, YaiO family [Pedobacter insulae]